MKTKLAIQLYTVRDSINQNLEKTLEQLANLGFKDLEIYGYNGTFFWKNA
jgi:sugar phosphate isomerase/epimerase